MKLSQFINEYDYLGKIPDGDKIRIWEDPSPSDIEKELKLLGKVAWKLPGGGVTTESEYLRGAMSSDYKHIYIAQYYDMLTHADLCDALESVGIQARIPLFVLKNHTIKLFLGNDKDDYEKALATLTKRQSALWVFKNEDWGKGFNISEAEVFKPFKPKDATELMKRIDIKDEQDVYQALNKYTSNDNTNLLIDIISVFKDIINFNKWYVEYYVECPIWVMILYSFIRKRVYDPDTIKTILAHPTTNLNGYIVLKQSVVPRRKIIDYMIEQNEHNNKSKQPDARNPVFTHIIKDIIRNGGEPTR